MCVNAACNMGKLSTLFDFAVKYLSSEQEYFVSFRSQASSPSRSHFRSFRHKKHDEHLKSRKSKKKARSRYESVCSICIDPKHHKLLHSRKYLICWVFFSAEQLTHSILQHSVQACPELFSGHGIVKYAEEKHRSAVISIRIILSLLHSCSCGQQLWALCVQPWYFYITQYMFLVENSIRRNKSHD
jgi:hypothetical protein